jgi:Fibronectin type III domain
MLRTTTTIRRSSRVTALLTVLVLTAGLLALAGPSTAAASSTSAQRLTAVKTSSWLSVNAATRIAGEPIKLSANVYPQMRRRVVVQRKLGPKAKWRTFVSGLTNADGVLPREFTAGTKDAKYRVVVPALRRGSHKYKGSRSKVLKVNAVEQEARLSMRVSSGGDTIEASVWAAPFRHHRPVRIQVLGDRWRTLAVGELDEEGMEEFTFLRAASGTYRFRAVIQQWRGADKVVTAPQRLVITAPRDRTAPPKPEELRAEPGDASVELVWNKVEAPDFGAYLVSMRPTGTKQWSTLVVDGNVAYLRVTRLTNGTSYEFVVTAVDQYGNESKSSNTVTGTPKAAPPTGQVGGGQGGGTPVSVPAPGTHGSLAELWLEWFPWLPLLPFWP